MDAVVASHVHCLLFLLVWCDNWLSVHRWSGAADCSLVLEVRNLSGLVQPKFTAVLPQFDAQDLPVCCCCCSKAGSLAVVALVYLGQIHRRGSPGFAMEQYGGLAPAVPLP